VVSEQIQNLLQMRKRAIIIETLKTKATGIRDGMRLYGHVILVDIRDNHHQCVKLSAETLNVLQKNVTALDKKASRVLYRITDVKREGKWVVAIRSVETRDFVTASITNIPWRILRDTSRLILSSNREISAVYYDITPKPPASIEFE
jgi:GMP synthase (glutamine-hydrolysing)